VLLGSLAIVPHECDHPLVSAALGEVQGGVLSELSLNLAELVRCASELGLDDQLQRRNSEIDSRLKEPNLFAELLASQVGKNRCEERPEKVLHVVFVIDVPLPRLT